MTLLITVFAAIISTIVWYQHSSRDEMKLGFLCLMFWGASIMWFVDAVFEYMELHEKFFTPSAADMLNDSYLGLSVVALGLVIWLIALLIKDPKGVLKSMCTSK